MRTGFGPIDDLLPFDILATATVGSVFHHSSLYNNLNEVYSYFLFANGYTHKTPHRRRAVRLVSSRLLVSTTTIKLSMASPNISITERELMRRPVY